MWGTHLKQKGRWWHYYRAVPREFQDVERRKLISFSLKTGDFVEARRRAAEISSELEHDWQDAKARGVSLRAQDSAERYRAAVAVQRTSGLEPKCALDMSDEALIERLRSLLGHDQTPPEQKSRFGTD